MLKKRKKAFYLMAIMFIMDNLMKAMSQEDCALRIGIGILDNVKVQVYPLQMTAYAN